MSEKDKTCTIQDTLDGALFLASNSLSTNDFRLFEAPDQILQAVQDGTILELKGDEKGNDIVLCTEEQTFSLRTVETSNTCLLYKSEANESAILDTSPIVERQLSFDDSQEIQTQTAEQNNNKTTEQNNNKTSEQNNNKTSEQTNNKTSEQNNNKTSEQNNNKMTGQTNNKMTGQNNNKTSEQNNNKTNEQNNKATDKHETFNNHTTDLEVSQNETVLVYTIEGLCSSYYEVKLTDPRVWKIQQLLSKRPYCGIQAEQEYQEMLKQRIMAASAKSNEESDMTTASANSKQFSTKTHSENDELYTLEMLEYSVQASRRQILESLHTIGAVQLEGYWRLLNDSYLFDLIDSISLLIQEQGWSLDKIPINTCITLLSYSNTNTTSDFPSTIIQHGLHLLSNTQEMDTSNNETIKLNIDTLARYRAQEILFAFRETDPNAKATLETFTALWRKSLQDLPDALDYEPKLELVEGMALLSGSTKHRVIQYFPSWELPFHPKDRFDALFKIRVEWKLEDLEPFIRDLCGPTQKRDDLLLEYCRYITLPDGTHVYCAR